MNLIYLITFLVIIQASLSFGFDKNLAELEDIFHDEYVKYQKSRKISPTLKTITEELSIPKSVISREWAEAPEPYATAFCVLCNILITTFIRLYHKGASGSDLRLVLDDIVSDLFHIYPRHVADGAIDLNLAPILFIVDNTPNLTASTFCGLVFQTSSCESNDPLFNWTVNVDLGNKPPQIQKEIMQEEATYTMLQITDFHYDQTYLVGGNAECDAPTCCREDSGIPSSEEAVAGFWGDYRSCDTPSWAIVDALQQIKQQHPKIDMIYMTGDLIDHGVWNTSIEKNTYAINQIFANLSEAFPNVPVVPVVGNHESNPLDLYSPPSVSDPMVSTKWLYELMNKNWERWLPEDTKETVLRGGFYTFLLKPGLRVIVLNNNVCYTYNWWLIYDPVDPSGQLQWLAETLIQAEKDKEKVHILYHVPCGSGYCYSTWSREHHKIISRFDGTISAIFDAHTHRDEFTVLYDHDDATRPNIVQFNGGSITTYNFVNPNYKIYTLDAKTGKVLDYESWVFNITEANLSPDKKPSWYKLYSFKEAYGMTSLEPQDYDKLTHRLAKDRNLLQMYYSHYIKLGDPLLEAGCDEMCMKDRLCDMVKGQTNDTTQCDILKKEFDDSKPILEKVKDFFERIENKIISFVYPDDLVSRILKKIAK